MTVSVFISTIDAACGAASRYCTEADFAAADAFGSARRSREYIGGRALVRFAIAEATGIAAAGQEIGVADGGKPVCRAGPEFNLSHSGSWLVCAVTSSGSVGVDLQFPAGHLSPAKIAERFFSAAERAWVRAGDERRFYMLWTLKEAHLKASGLSVMAFLNGLQCRLSGSDLRAVSHKGAPTQSSLYSFADGFLAIATTESFAERPEFHTPEWVDLTMERVPKPIPVARASSLSAAAAHP